MWDLTFIYLKHLQQYMYIFKNNLIRQYNYYYNTEQVPKMTFVVIDEEDEAQEIDISIDDNMEIFYSTIENSTPKATLLVESTFLPKESSSNTDLILSPTILAEHSSESVFSNDLFPTSSEEDKVLYYSTIDN